MSIIIIVNVGVLLVVEAPMAKREKGGEESGG